MLRPDACSRCRPSLAPSVTSRPQLQRATASAARACRRSRRSTIRARRSWSSTTDRPTIARLRAAAAPRVRSSRMRREPRVCPGVQPSRLREADADIVVLLNNDTRVTPAWLDNSWTLRNATRALRPRPHAGLGRLPRVDFVGGLPTFVGHSWQVDHGRPVGRALHRAAAAVRLRRRAARSVGTLSSRPADSTRTSSRTSRTSISGWRMSLAGHETVLAPRAITYHRLHGTARRWGHTLRLRLYERNALARSSRTTATRRSRGYCRRRSR